MTLMNIITFDFSTLIPSLNNFNYLFNKKYTRNTKLHFSTMKIKKYLVFSFCKNHYANGRGQNPCKLTHLSWYKECTSWTMVSTIWYKTFTLLLTTRMERKIKQVLQNPVCSSPIGPITKCLFIQVWRPRGQQRSKVQGHIWTLQVRDHQ